MYSKENILKTLEKIILELGISDVEPQVSVPAEMSHGDYTTNIAMQLARKLKKTPMQVGEQIVQDLRFKTQDLGLEKLELIKPGFINFWVSKDSLINNLNQLLKGKKKIVKKIKSKKIMLEFADPNPFKEFHIGHLRNISLGESYARLMEEQGNEVWRVNYQGDVGMHVAKCLYGLGKIGQIENKSLLEKVKFLGKAYAFGAKAYEEDENARKEIQDINKKVYRKDPSILGLWGKGRAWSMDYFETIYKRVGTTYKRYYPESEVAEKGKEIVLSHVADGIFEKSDGAVVYHGEKEGLHTRVFVTKEDYATYEAKDMALAPLKYADFPYDRSIIITAHEQSNYFEVVLSAMRKVFPDLGAKTQHQAFGFVQLKESKMSSRTGNVIAGMWLLNEAKLRLKKVFPEMPEEVLEQVAVGAVKYSMLKFGRTSDISFSFEESISLEGNSGPYIQYAYARAQSILLKAKKISGIKYQVSTMDLEPEEVLLLRQLIKFEEVIEAAANQFAPNLLCNYLFELASSFNLFYQKRRIIGSETEELRLRLTKGVAEVLKKGLYLLGIKSPEKM